MVSLRHPTGASVYSGVQRVQRPAQARSVATFVPPRSELSGTFVSAFSEPSDFAGEAMPDFVGQVAWNGFSEGEPGAMPGNVGHVAPGSSDRGRSGHVQAFGVSGPDLPLGVLSTCPSAEAEPSQPVSGAAADH
jgi:hypothetical protein